MTGIATRPAVIEHDTDPFVGRAESCALLDALVASVPGGGAAVVVVGEAGVGKTALMRRIAARASCSQRWIGGSRAETMLPFACAADLLTPFRKRFDAVPPSQRRALEVAFALDDGPPPSMLAICAGVLGVLAAVGEDDPLVAFVDDLQWMDAESRQLLLFAARRIVSERVVLVFALRSEVGREALVHGLPEVRLEGLDAAECQELGRLRYPRLRAGELDELVSATGGNPHAVLETLARWEPSARSDEVTIGLDVRRPWQQLLDPLPPGTRRALFALAAGEAPGVPAPPIVLEALGLQLADLEPAERLGLLRVVGDRVTLRHPLLRQVVVDTAPLGVVQTTYHALAKLAAPEHQSWFLAKAAVGPDHVVADALFAASGDARRRGGHATASRLARRAAELTAQPAERAERLLVAASDALLVGKPAHTERCCAEALALRSDAEFVAEAAGLQGHALMWMGQGGHAADQLVSAAERMPDEQSATAARLLHDALIPMTMRGDVRRALATARRSESLAPAEDASFHGKVMLAVAYLMAGRSAEGRARLELAQRTVPRVDSAEQVHALVSLVQARWLAEDFDVTLISAAIETLRSTGTSAVMALALAIRGELGIRTGRWAGAYADAIESAHWAGELHQPGVLGYALTLAARIDAARGERAKCEEYVEQARRAAGPQSSACLTIQCTSALGLAALTQGEATDASDLLAIAWEQAKDQGLAHPDVVPFAGDLIEAHVHAGQPDRARQVVGWLEVLAAQSGLSHAAALAGRGRGMLEEDPVSAADAFAIARAAHERCPMPFERARTLLCEGELLRRSRQLVAARAPLREAQLLFDGLGAHPWAQRADRELAAAGARVRHRDRPAVGLDALTPQELQLAKMVSVGKNNVEAAAALFVSRKTVEAHLTRIYRKLGICSRTELTRVIVAHDAVG